MADKNKNEVFGGFSFNGEPQKKEDITSYFEGNLESKTIENDVIGTFEGENDDNGEQKVYNVVGKGIAEENTQNSQGDSNVFGSFETQNGGAFNGTVQEFQSIEPDKALVKPSFWSKLKSFFFQEIDLSAPVKFGGNKQKNEVVNQAGITNPVQADSDSVNKKFPFKGIVNLFKKN